MQLFYASLNEDSSAELFLDEIHHCLDVLRHKIGDKINITNGEGTICKAEIIFTNKKSVRLKIFEVNHTPLPFYHHISLNFGILKNMDRMEWMVEKACEIGIGKIQAFVSKNCERKVINMERFQKIALSAMKQSNQAWLTKIEPLEKFSVLINQESANTNYFAHCYETQLTHLFHAYNKEQPAKIWIGPEGDFSPDEVELAKTKSVNEVSLGNTRLRTETASIYALMACHLQHLTR